MQKALLSKCSSLPDADLQEVRLKWSSEAITSADPLLTFFACKPLGSVLQFFQLSLRGTALTACFQPRRVLTGNCNQLGCLAVSEHWFLQGHANSSSSPQIYVGTKQTFNAILQMPSINILVINHNGWFAQFCTGHMARLHVSTI